MTIPNLAGVIVKDDVFQKGSGSFAASYVSWARIANYLHTKASGWQFHLRPAPNGDLIWKAPDGTGFVVSYFSGPDGETTADFPFPCQDNRNAPIPYERISCRTLTDTHRRALCANAAFSFSLGYELWAREEIESAGEEPIPDQPKAVSTNKTSRAAAKPAPATQPRPAAPAGPPAATAEDLQAIKQAITALAPDQRSVVVDQFRARFGTPPNVGIADHIKTQEHISFLTDAVSSLTGGNP